MKAFFRCFVWAILMGFIACLIGAGLIVSCHGQVDAGDELDAISLVEGPPPGPAGEGTPWGILPATWALWSKVPMDRADPLLQRSVALAILYDIEAKLPGVGMPVTEYTVALAWIAGMDAVKNRRFRMVHFDYAERVRNICRARKRKM